MPRSGPDGRPVYLPHEAFNLIGRKVYDQEWREAFSGGEPLPDLEMKKRILARGGPDADRIQRFGELDDSDYEINLFLSHLRRLVHLQELERVGPARHHAADAWL